jgi:hypothetical protein
MDKKKIYEIRSFEEEQEKHKKNVSQRLRV